MRKILIAMLFAVVLTACTKPYYTLNFPFKTGTYSGTFQRLGLGNEPVTAVTLHMDDGKWNGTGEVEKYPGLCNGSYSFDFRNKIKFANYCNWTADFDWTLILDGEFEYRIEGDTVVMERLVETHRQVYRLGMVK